ncbi:MAG: V-type ATP synthase subunit K [Actinomycetota bacterium]|nr:V-type ATP synthase subunit K [Actinomycetota bacterium]
MSDSALGILLAIIGSGLATLLAGIGSAVGISFPAKAAAGVISEDPSKFGGLFLLVVLPGTQGFYGFVAAFLIIGKIAQISTMLQGLQLLGAALPVGIVGFWSAIYQGKVAAAGVNLAAKRPKEVIKGVIFAAMVETYAVLGLLISFFLINAVKL